MPSNEHSVKINIPEVKLLPCEAVVHDVSLFADEDEENKIAIRCLNTKKKSNDIGSSKNETEVVKSDNGARLSLSDDPNNVSKHKQCIQNIASKTMHPKHKQCITNKYCYERRGYVNAQTIQHRHS